MNLIAYYRVSTQKQGQTGYGLQSQKRDVAAYVKSHKGILIAEFTEVASGRKNRRPEFRKALELCKEKGAILIAAKLDRISRKSLVLKQIKESGIEVAICDMPSANNFMMGILAEIAEYEADLIRERTRKGLSSAKQQGKTLGNPNINQKGDEKRKELAKQALLADKDSYRREIIPDISRLLELANMREAPKQKIADLLNNAKKLTPRQFVAVQNLKPIPDIKWHRTTIYRLFNDYPELSKKLCLEKIA